MVEATNSIAGEYRLIGPSDDGHLNDVLAGLDAKQARQRLQALISEWLRLENVVVLTGAGCSKSSGGKLMPELERAVLGTVSEMAECPESVRKLVASRVSYRADPARAGFEEWLSFLVNATFVSAAHQSPFSNFVWRDAPGPSLDELAWLVRAVGQSIFVECALSLNDTTPTAQSASDIAPHLAFLSKLVARDSNLGRIHLFELRHAV